MKVLLIEPPPIIPIDWSGILKIFPPIGLGYLAAMLEKAGHKVKILDARLEKQINKFNDKLEYIGMTYEQLAEYVKKENPDLIGMGGWSVQKFSIFRTIEMIKKINPDVKVLVGGILASVEPEILSNPNIDFVIRGEGEYTIVELVDSLENDNDLKEIRGLGFKENGKSIFNELRPPIQNLDEIPFPAYHLLNMEKYFEETQSPSEKEYQRMGSIVSSRGCPYNCCFCCVHTLVGREWRPRSPENVVEEIEFLIKNYSTNRVGFWDDNIALSKKRFIRILELIKEKKLNVKLDLTAIFRADTLDEEVFEKLREIDVKNYIYISPETGDQWVLDNIVDKRLNLKYVERAVVLAKKFGFKIGCHFVIGMPGETQKNIENTYEFTKKLRKNGALIICHICLPFPGTRVYQECIKNNYLTTNSELDYTMALLSDKAIIKTSEFTPEEIHKWRQKIEGTSELGEILSVLFKNPIGMFKMFFAHPRHILNYLLDKYIWKTH